MIGENKFKTDFQQGIDGEIGQQDGLYKEPQNFNQPNMFNPNNFEGGQNFPKSSNMNNFYQGSGMGNYYFNNNNMKMQQGKYDQNNQNNQNNFYGQSGYVPKSHQQQQYYYKKNNQNDEYNVIQSLKYVSDNYAHLVTQNNNNIGITEKVRNQSAPRFFVIKSFTEEDIHKSIKYSCWSSTREGNKKLNQAYEEGQRNGYDIFLFFSMNGSGRFVGVARMASKVDFERVFEYWAMDEVWKGLMQVEWLFIKDVPNRLLKDIKLSNNGFKPVTNSRDTQEIPRPEGEQMLSIFEEYVYQTSILQHFQYYDERQDLFEKARLAQK